MSLKGIFAAILCSSIGMHAYAQTSTDPVKKQSFGKNVWAISPIQLSENGVEGIGVSYERTLDKDGILSLYIPVSAVLNTNSENRLGTNAHYNDPMYYVMPGIKLYPTGNKGLAKYAIGPSLVLAAGERTYIDDNVYPTSSYNGYVTRSRSLFGIMINQSLNINATPHLYIGSEFGFGYSYINKLDGNTQNITGLVQFSFKIGYRY